MTLQRGSPGQFDVVVDGEVVAAKKHGFLATLLGSGWPDPHAVVDAIAARRTKP